MQRKVKYYYCGDDLRHANYYRCKVQHFDGPISKKSERWSIWESYGWYWAGITFYLRCRHQSEQRQLHGKRLGKRSITDIAIHCWCGKSEFIVGKRTTLNQSLQTERYPETKRKKHVRWESHAYGIGWYSNVSSRSWNQSAKQVLQ